MYAPEVSTTWVRSRVGRKSLTSLRPISRFMNELAVIIPTNPAEVPRAASGVAARWKNSSVNGTPREYLPEHESHSSR